MPRRWAFRAILAASLTAFTLAPSLFAQNTPADDVFFRDPETGKIESVKTVTKESPGGIAYTDGKTPKTISVKNLVRVDYGALPGVSASDRLNALTKENDAESPKDLKQFYAELLKKGGATIDKKTERAFTFREAYWSAKTADALPPDDFAKEIATVIPKLEQVITLSRNSWEGWPATEMLAEIHTELGAYDKAAEVWSRMAATPGLPPVLKIEAQLAEVTAKIRAGGGLAAEGVIGQIAADKAVPATGTIPDQIEVLKVAAKVPMPRTTEDKVQIPADTVAKLTGVIAKVKDPIAKGIGYNFLGDVYRLSGNTREAMWAYLWVDVVYTGSTCEQLYSLHRLINLFESTGDQERAEQFREKLPQVR